MSKQSVGSELVVHSVPGSPFGRSVFALLEEKGAPYRLAPVVPGMNRSEPHILLHPFGRVPVLEHDGYVLYETQAILRYLDRVLPTPPLTPAEPRAVGRMDQVMNINDWYLFQGVGNVVAFERLIKPRLLKQPADEANVAQALPKGRTVFAELSRLLGGNRYFAGENLSLADLLVAPQMGFLALTPEWAALSADTPNLVAWLARMNERASMKATTWERIAQLAAA